MACEHDDKKAAMLVMLCLNARTQAHVLHLAATGDGSYAEHVALGDFYKGIGDLADGFAEVYQGMSGTLLKLPALPIKPAGAIPMLDALEDWIDENRDDICDKSNVQNEIDTIVSLIQTTRYKLKFLA